MGAPAPADDRLPAGAAPASPASSLIPNWARRKTGIHHQDHGGAGRLAGAARRSRWPTGDRPAGEEAAGDRRIDFTSAYAKPGETQIRSTCGRRAPGRVPDVWYQVRKEAGDIQRDLPRACAGPFFNDEFGDTFGNLYALTGDGFGAAELRDSPMRRNEFLRVADVNKVDLVGVQDEKHLHRGLQRQAGLLGWTRADRLDPGRHQHRGRGCGTDIEQVRLTVSGEFDSVDAIRNIGIRAGGRTFRLGDIAERSRRGVVDPPASRMRFNGQEAVGLAVSMRKGRRRDPPGWAAEATVRRVRPICRWVSRSPFPTSRGWSRNRSTSSRTSSGSGGHRAPGQLLFPSACAPAWWWPCAFPWCWR